MLPKTFKGETKYLEEFNLTDDGGVVKKVIRYGEQDGEDAIALPGQKVILVYEARLENGAVVDNWKDHRGNKDVPTTEEGMILTAGMGEVIDGWDMCVLTMRLGEACDCFIASKYAFGEEGRPPKIPKNAKVIFNIEIVQVGDRKTSKPVIESKDHMALLTQATKNKMDGNQFFKAKDYAKAIKTYKDTIDVLDLINLETTRQNTTIINDLRVTTHQNLAMSLNATEKYDEAIFHCEHAIIVNEKSAKAHFIKSQAFEKQQEYEKALVAIKKAIVLSPNDRKLREDMTRIQALKTKANEGMGSKISNFISGGIYNEKESKIKKQKHKVVHDKLPKFNPENVQCYFDLQIGFDNEKEEDKQRGRVVFELFDKDVPDTVENFRVHCTGEKDQKHMYQDKRIHRIVLNYMMIGGDTSAAADGTGGKSIYEDKDEIHSKDGFFRDENVWFPHSHMGTLSMQNTGKDTNGSQFLIQLRDRIEYFDEKNTCFGRIISGYEFMANCQENPRKEEKPIRPVIIHACGELRMGDKLTEEQADFLPNYERNVYFEDEQREARKLERRKLIDAKEAEEKKILDAKKAEDKENEDRNGIPGDIFSKIYENAEKEKQVEMSEADKKLLDENLKKPLKKQTLPPLNQGKQTLPPLKPESIKEREEQMKRNEQAALLKKEEEEKRIKEAMKKREEEKQRIRDQTESYVEEITD